MWDGQREQGRREIWEVTVNTHARRYNHTINIERHKHRRAVWGSKTKAQEKQAGGVVEGGGLEWSVRGEDWGLGAR